MTKSDTLIIGFDQPEGSDLACLTIGRMEGLEYHMLKSLCGDKAIKTYQKLVDPATSQP